MPQLRPEGHLQAGLSWSRWVFASGDSVTLSGNLKLLQTWRIPGKKRWKGLEIKIIVPRLGKKEVHRTFSLDTLGEEGRKRGKEEGGWSSVTKQHKLKHFPLEKSQFWKIIWFWVHKCSVGGWCWRKWKNFFSSKVSIFLRKKKCFHGSFFGGSSFTSFDHWSAQDSGYVVCWARKWEKIGESVKPLGNPMEKWSEMVMDPCPNRGGENSAGVWCLHLTTLPKQKGREAT